METMDRHSSTYLVSWQKQSQGLNGSNHFFGVTQPLQALWRFSLHLMEIWCGPRMRYGKFL
jgi:hypothetical protein